MSKLISWRDYQNVRHKLAEYNNVLVLGQPKKDLSNDEVNDIFIYQMIESKVHNIAHISKSFSSPFYRDIGLGKDFKTLIKDYFLIEPSTMPNKNTTDSILSWARYSRNMEHTLSEEDREKYPSLATGDNVKLRFGKDYKHIYTEA